MAVVIQLRRGLSAEWASVNPVLAEGEVAVETDTGLLKVGNGALPWSSLPYTKADPSQISAAVSAAVSGLVDSAPGALDTLNELAAALGDDPNFATTVSSQIALKADDADLDSHVDATTSVHGIANTAELETQTGSQAKADNAFTAATAYADSLAPNYDSAGSASAAQAAVETALSTHSVDSTNVHGIADTSLLETQSGAQSKADAAETSATAYADSLAPNYDPAGSASSAQTAAQAYTDTEIDGHNADTTNVHGIANTADLATKLYADTAASTAQTAAQAYADQVAADLVNSAPETLDTLNELAAALGDDPNFATTVATQIGTKADSTDLTSHTSATTNVHGIPDTSELETQTGAQAKADNALTAANTYTDTIINALDTDDIEEGASSQYFTAERAQDAAAQMIVGGTHTNVSVEYDGVAGILSLTGAETYGSVEFDADLATKDTDDLAEGGNLYFTNQRALDATAAAYDAAGSAAAAQSAAEDYTDSVVAAFDALPSQTGNDGKFLTTDGSTATWQTLPGLATSVEVLFEAPAGTPPMGACYFDALLNTLRIYNGGAWVSMAAEEGSVISAGSASNPGTTLYNAGDSDDPATGTAPVNGGTSAG